MEGRILYTAGALWEAAVGGAEGAESAAVARTEAGEQLPGRQLPTVAAVHLQQAVRPVGCGVAAGAGVGGREGAVRHVMTSHHVSAVFQDKTSGSLLLGTGTPLLLHVS